MTRAPDWTAEEFQILLSHPEFSDDELAELLPRRSANAINWVRSGIREFRDGGGSQILSEEMRRILAAT